MFQFASKVRLGQRRLEESNALLCHAYAEHASTLVGGTSMGPLALFRTRRAFETDASGCLLVEGHVGSVTNVVYDADIKLVVSSSADASLRIWDVEPQAGAKMCIQTLRGHKGTVLGCMTHYGSMILSYSIDGSVMVWAVDPASRPFKYPVFVLSQRIQVTSSPKRSIPLPWVTAIDFAATRASVSGTLIVAHTDGAIDTYRAVRKRGSRAAALKVPYFEHDASWPFLHKQGAYVIKWVARDNIVFTLSFENVVKMIDISTGQVIVSQDHPHEKPFTSCAYNSSTEELYLIDESETVFVWFLNTRRALASFAFTHGPLTSISLTDAGHVRLTSPESAELWHVEHFERLVEHRGHTAPIGAMGGIVRTSSEGAAASGVGAKSESVDAADGLMQLLVTAGQDDLLIFWDVIDMHHHSQFKERTSEVTALAYDPSSDMLVTGHENGDMALWNIETGATIRVDAHSNTVTCLEVVNHSFSTSNTASKQFVISGSYDGTVAVWDIARIARTQKAVPRATFDAGIGEIYALVYSAEGELVIGGADPPLRIWAFDGSQCLSTLKLNAHTMPINALVRDGSVVISCADDMTIRVWDTRSHIWLRTIVDAHTAPITSLLMVPETPLLASADEVGVVSLWEYATTELSGGLAFVSAASSSHVDTLRREGDDRLAGASSFAAMASPLAVTPSTHALSRMKNPGRSGSARMASLSVGTATPLASFANDVGITDLAYIVQRREVAASTHNGTVVLIDINAVLDAFNGVDDTAAAAAVKQAAADTAAAALAALDDDAIAAAIEAHYTRDLSADDEPNPSNENSSDTATEPDWDALVALEEARKKPRAQ
ncbi:uncharacterized protein AMSG_07094, partial [Thecamonas trahens ATCC 50062]